MTIEIIGLIITFLLGLFILVGAILAIVMGNTNKIIEYSLGLALGVIITLIITDLIPEIIENIEISKIYIAVISIIAGYLLLRLLDRFVPDHENDHSHKHSKKESQDNLIHIGIITSIALIIHNIIEGMAVYSTSITANTSLVIGMTLGVGFHNLPLGMVITSSIYQTNKSKRKTIISLLAVSISTFIGGLIVFLFHIDNTEGIISGILLSLTLGMLVYIAIDELIPRIKIMKEKKVAIYGIITGVIILLISTIF